MRAWISLVGAGALIALLLPFAQRRAAADDPLAKASGALSGSGQPGAPGSSGQSGQPGQWGGTAPSSASARPIGPPPLTGVDLSHIKVLEQEATAPAAAGRVAHLTLDPNLQRVATKLLQG